MIPGQNGDNAPTEDGSLERWLFGVEPDTASKGPLLQRPTKHLLAGQTQKVSMPDQENATPDTGSAGNKGHPLGEPLGKIVHTIQDGGVDFFEIGLRGMKGCILRPEGLGLPIVQRLIQHTMGRRKGVHCRLIHTLRKPVQCCLVPMALPSTQKLKVGKVVLPAMPNLYDVIAVAERIGKNFV